MAACHRLRAVDRRTRKRCLPERHRRHYRRRKHRHRAGAAANQLAGSHRSGRAGSDRRPLARGVQQPRQVLQRAERSAAGGEHRQRARRLHRPVGHGHRRGTRWSAVERDQPIRVQGELRSRHLGRRQEIRDRPRDRRSPGRRQRQSAERAAVVGGRAARRTGGRRRDDQRLGYAAADRDDERCDADPGSVPAREPLCGAAELTHQWVGRGVAAAHGAVGAQLPAWRQVERGGQHDELPHAQARPGRHRLFRRGARRRTKRSLYRYGKGRLAKPRLFDLQVEQGVANSDGLRRRQRRDDACVRRQPTNGGKEAWAYVPAALYSGGDRTTRRTAAFV